SHASVLLRLVGPRRQTGISALTPRIKMPIAQLRPRPQAVGAFPRYYLKLVRESGWFHRFGSEGTRIRDSSLERVPLGMTARFCKISFNLFLARVQGWHLLICRCRSRGRWRRARRRR